MNESIHSCGYHCRNPACVLAQRDELVAKYVAQPVQLVKPAGTPLADAQLLTILAVLDSSTKRLPPGFRQFARAIEAAHGIKPASRVGAA